MYLGFLIAVLKCESDAYQHFTLAVREKFLRRHFEIRELPDLFRSSQLHSGQNIRIKK
jgi:hypothetical protein